MIYGLFVIHAGGPRRASISTFPHSAERAVEVFLWTILSGGNLLMFPLGTRISQQGDSYVSYRLQIGPLVIS